MTTYCDIAPGHEVHGPYHDTEYGFPVDDDRVLFERLCLEIFQAGLSWILILRRREGMNAAFDGFDPATVAAYGDADAQRLLGDARIIRNRLKVAAIIDNARKVLELQNSHGSFAAWLAANHPMTRPEWVKLFKKTFRFTGGEVVNEFLMSVGYLPGSHDPMCPVRHKLDVIVPPWLNAQQQGHDFGS